MSKLVVKIGTNVICTESGSPDLEVMRSLVAQVGHLVKVQNKQIALISSGAVGFGRKHFLSKSKAPIKSANNLVAKQIYSAIGQIRLINTFFELFAEVGLFCAQVLATKEDFRSRKHFLHMRDCVNGLLDNGIVPILNENDTISTSDVMFSDNDELAGLTSAMIDAEKLVILTSIDGLFNKNPSSADAKLIKEVKPQDDFRQFISKEKSSLGRGGMGNKCQIARRIASLGIETWIVNGKSREIITKSDQGKALGTRFLPEKKTTAVRKWLAVSKGTEKGSLEVNKGAYEGILRGGSILFVGIIKVSGEFQKGDLVRLVNSEGEDFGLAVAAFGSKKSQELIGQKDHKPFARRDFIFLY